jgi:DNA processing protein
MEAKVYLVALQQIPGLGSRKLLRLLQHFGSAQEIWAAPAEEFRRLSWLGGKTITAIIAERKRLDPQLLYEKVVAGGMRVVTIEDADYPVPLKQIYAPPVLLYVKGNLPLPGELVIAMVGSRQATPYGRQVALKLAAELAGYGIWVVSGLARGIDSCVHRGVLREGGKTVSVLGSGLDVVYPRENVRMLQEIIVSGGAVSEYPPGTQPLPGHFPARNRIISGMAAGTVVVEASARSGALITAELALEQGREVFAVPGPVTSNQSAGVHKLIQDGAKLAGTVTDILEEFNLKPLFHEDQEATPSGGQNLTAQEKKVLALLVATPVHIEQLIIDTGLEVPEMTKILTYLELKGLARQLPGKYFLATAT